MRFLHTSDWHLGRTLHGVDLLDAQRAVLDQIRQVVTDPPDGIPIEAVIVAGDIYDRAVPPVEAVTLFSDTLAELTAHTTVIVTAGNHDSAIRLGFGSGLFTDRLRLRTDLATIAEPVLVGTGSNQVAVYPLPYLDPDVARTVLSDSVEPLHRSHQAVMTAALDQVRADLASRPGTRSIVVAHAFVVGGAPSESERSIVVGGVDCVAADTFHGVDYVALGHLHGAQQPHSTAGTVLAYSGSPLRYSFSELNHTKSITLVDLAADGSVQLRRITLKQPREMVDLAGTLSELLAGTEYSDDWVRLTITDRVRPDQLFDRVKARFPHALQVLHAPQGSIPAGTAPGTATADRNPLELGGDFIRHVTGTDACATELALFEQAYQAALVDAGGV